LFNTSCPLNCASVDQTLLSYRSVRGQLSGFLISRVADTYSCGGLEPKSQRNRGALVVRQPRAPAALRSHVPQHTTWKLPCALLPFVESTVQAKIYQSAKSYKVPCDGPAMESRRRLTSMKGTLDTLGSNEKPDGRLRASIAGQNGDYSRISSIWSRHAHNAAAHW